jgi:K+-sensing histidine kinase KdpD
VILLPLDVGQRDYIFLYLALVAAIGVLRGLLPALLCAALSFLLVDYFFVQPLHTLSIANEADLVNLAVFFGTAGVVGGLGSNRRLALKNSQALARQLEVANRRQREAHEAAMRLARKEQEVTALQQTVQDRRDLLANVSHDLRTPISSILTDSTNMLLTQQMNASVRYRLEAIASEARRLNRLVGEMLDMARIEGGALNLHLEPIAIADAVTAATDRLHRTSPERPVQFDQQSAHLTVLADWHRLGQILDNLFANADRVAPKGTPIVVRASQDQAGFVTIRVTDSGPGVPREIRDSLFNRFVKGDSESQDGTGLGLAITRGLVEAHNGTIELEDNPDHEGATFRFTLPKAES